MLFFDVNVPIAAFVEDAPDHAAMAGWLDGLLNGSDAFGVNEPVLSGFVRIVTLRRFHAGPVDISRALDFASRIRNAATAQRITPGTGHWDIFRRLCEGPGIRGNLVPDAYLAALAIEQDLEFVTTDADFARFPGLRWRHPLRPN